MSDDRECDGKYERKRKDSEAVLPGQPSERVRSEGGLLREKEETHEENNGPMNMFR